MQYGCFEFFSDAIRNAFENVSELLQAQVKLGHVEKTVPAAENSSVAQFLPGIIDAALPK